MSRLFSSLRSQVFTVALLSAFPIVMIMLYSGFEERKRATLQAEQDALRLLDLASTHQARVIEETFHLLRTLSQSSLSCVPHLDQCSAYLQTQLTTHPHYLNLGVIGADANVLCTALQLESGTDFSGRDFYRYPLEDGGFAVGTSPSRSETGKASLDVGYPIHDANGHISALVFAEVDLTWLSDLTTYFGKSDGATLTLLDWEGRIIIRHPESERWVGKAIPNTGALQEALEKRKGIIKARGLDGVDRWYAYTLLDGVIHPTILYTGIPTSTIYAGPKLSFSRNIIVLVAVTILSLLAAYLFGHFAIMRRVDALMRAAARLARGDLIARTGIALGGSELEQLGAALDGMAEFLEQQSIERDKVEVALRRSEEQYRNLVEQIPGVMYTAALDESHTLLFISPQVETLLGFDQADFYDDHDTWNRLLHAEDRERVLGEISRFRQEKDLFICEYRMLTRNKFVKWIRDEAVVVLNNCGAPPFIQGIMTDITEQKTACEELEKANRELETRVVQRTELLNKANEELRLGAERLKLLAASVAHDIKSPITGIYGLTKLLSEQYRNAIDEKGMRYFSSIMKASEHILNLAEKVNAYIATKATPLHIQEVDLREVLTVLREEFSLRLAARSIAWVQCQPPVKVRADRLSLLRMFRNFIDNALKYGGEQLTEIRIGYEETEDFHIFSVSDDGRGVSKEDSIRLFEIFHRSSASIGIEGTGLGLAIVKEIAEKHGGSVSVKTGVEKGVTFSCSISRNL